MIRGVLTGEVHGCCRLVQRGHVLLIYCRPRGGGARGRGSVDSYVASDFVD